MVITAIISFSICADEIFNFSSKTTNEEIKFEEETATPSIDKYTIKAGDSYWSISKELYGSGIYYTALAMYNNFEITDTLVVGKTILVPNVNDPKFVNIMNQIQNKNIENIETWNQEKSGTTINAGPSTKYKYGTRSNPSVNINVPELNQIMKNYTKEVDTSTFTSLGSYKITGYTPACDHCCENTDGRGAAGVNMICGYSVAAPENIPFGTTLYIEGYGFYVVEDRGYLGNNIIDIACPTHEACYDITARSVNVYIVPNNN